MEVNLLSGALGAEVKGIDLKDSSEKNWQLINLFMIALRLINKECFEYKKYFMLLRIF